VSRSADLTRSFYAQLGAEGLANRTRPEWDGQIVAALLELLPARAQVLDAGCGYGRIALPLARAGYEVEGVDLSPNLLDAARAAAAAEDLAIGFTLGSITQLPFPAASFDAVLCLWSAFHELLEEDEQVQAVREFRRVLRAGGFALVEGPISEEAPEDRISWDEVEGILNPHFRHDEASYRRICKAAGVEQLEVFERDWAVRRRRFLRIERPRQRDQNRANSSGSCK